MPCAACNGSGLYEVAQVKRGAAGVGDEDKQHKGKIMNALVAYSDLERMANAMAKSRLFGVQTQEQAIALMLVAQAEGRHPASAANDYNIIQGRPAKKADAMLRDFLASGGKVQWEQLDDTAAIAVFSHPAGGSVKISWDIKRATSAGLGAKDMWKKYPRQMLRSRTVSEGIRTVCPMATSGMYVPEEVTEFAPEKNITPTAGAADNISEETAQKMRDLQAEVLKFYDAGQITDAVLTYENANLDADSKIYFWTLFDSKQRSAFKKEQKRLRDENEEKLAHGTQDEFVRDMEREEQSA